jgi:hypothetical protein
MTDETVAESPDRPLDKIRRVLDLDLAADRKELQTILTSHPSLVALTESGLIEDFLGWFKAPEWRTVYGGGMISGPQPKGNNIRHGSSIDQMLAITVQLRWLQGYHGFDQLIAGLNNPSQISATIFEIEAASWCATRLCTTALTFSPDVIKRERVKHPDFLWETNAGALYCECKQASSWQRSESRLLSTISADVNDAMGDADTWPTTVRIEVRIHGLFRAGAKNRLTTAVREQSSEVRRGNRPAIFHDDAFTVEVGDRSDHPEALADSLTLNSILVGQVPVDLNDPRNAYMMVSKAIGLARVKALKDLVRDAKKQLPDAGPGGVFVEIPSSVDLAAKKLEEMLGQSANQSVVWASIWTAGTPRRVVCRDDQPFDASLIVPN